MTWNVRKVFLKNVWCVYRARLFKLGLIWNEAKILLTSSLLWSGDDDPVVPRFNMIVACWHASICKALQSAAECLVFSFPPPLHRPSKRVCHHFHHSSFLRWRLFSWEECKIGAIIQNLLQCHGVYIILHNSISNIGNSAGFKSIHFEWNGGKSEKFQPQPRKDQEKKNNKIKWNFLNL